jgi:hypothetical protein
VVDPLRKRNFVEVCQISFPCEGKGEGKKREIAEDEGDCSVDASFGRRPAR